MLSNGSTLCYDQRATDPPHSGAVMNRLIVSGLTLGLALSACSEGNRELSADEIAEAYTRLVLTLGQHDKDYVDAYYGPADWAEAAAEDPLEPATIVAEAERLRQALA